MPLKPPDGKMKLKNCTLQQALESVYCEFAAVLLAYEVPRSCKLFEEDIPGMVFDVAVGAGWLPCPPEEENLPKTGRLHGKELVVLGEGKVERWYKDSFLALLEYWIGFHTEDPHTREEMRDNLPSIPKENRQALVEEFLAKQKAEGHPVGRVEMPGQAGVDYSDLRKWVRGTLPETSKKSKQILMLLLHNVRSEPKPQYHRAER
jgi:hypothetical protein